MDDDKLYDESEERPHIKVNDRRKFTADGTPRDATPEADELAGEATNEAPAADATEPVAAPPPAAPTQPNSPDEGAEADEEAPRIAAPQPSITDLPRDFGAFIETLYLEAVLYLGAIPDPRSGQLMEDDELAKYKIDLLGMLEEKTRGNLSAEEKQQLDDVLYQVRMLYTQKQQASKS